MSYGAFPRYENELRDNVYISINSNLQFIPSQAAIRHPGVFKRVAEHLVGSDDDFENGNSGRGMEGFSPQGLGNLAWACK